MLILAYKCYIVLLYDSMLVYNNRFSNVVYYLGKLLLIWELRLLFSVFKYNFTKVYVNQCQRVVGIKIVNNK